MTDQYKIGIIGDQDTISGFLLTGVGEKNHLGETNFHICDQSTSSIEIEKIFKNLIHRDDIGIVLITQFIADKIRGILDIYSRVLPTIIEIPSKEKSYGTSNDSLHCITQQYTHDSN